jgi:glycyl-tRNA synthetase
MKRKLDKVQSLAKRRGFVFQSSEIYGGWEATYDFGPLGAEVLRNLRNIWWEDFVQRRNDVVGIDGAIISHPRVWDASGHTESFSDVMVEDLVTNKRYRADHIIEDYLKGKKSSELKIKVTDDIKVKDGVIVEANIDGLKLDEVDRIIKEEDIKSPDGNKLSKSKYFNQLVEVYVGTTEDSKSKAYLRGETCQPIFCNYELVKDSMRMKLPFGIAQIGKAFRNEIKVGPYFYRTREFEQMELEMYLNQKDADKYFEEFKKISISWLEGLGINKKKLRLRDQEFKERAHYNKVATDVEYDFEFGWKEFQGIHYRSDWDLKRHGEFSGKDFTYKDSDTGEEYIPHIVEYSIGLNRLMFVLLYDSFCEEEKRVVLKLNPKLAPNKAAVFPLLSNKPELVEKARGVYENLLKQYHVAWDERGNIGKRYFAQDEIGTPWCITVDFDTLKDDAVTIRDRDTMKQERVNISKLSDWLASKLK